MKERDRWSAVIESHVQPLKGSVLSVFVLVILDSRGTALRKKKKKKLLMKCSTGFLPGFYLAGADVMMGGEEDRAHRELVL